MDPVEGAAAVDEEDQQVRLPCATNSATGSSSSDDEASNNEIASGNEAARNPRMELSEEEVEWAIAIKNAILGLPDVDNLPDFMYGQLALIDKGDVDYAVQRAYGLQHLREEYDLQDTYEHACRTVKESIATFPGFYLDFSFVERDDCYAFVCDMKGFDIKRLMGNPNGDALYVGGEYYMLHSMCPDFASIRKGTVMLLECDGYDWKRNIDVRLFKLCSEVMAAYPVGFNKMKHFNSGMFINMLLAVTKSLFPAQFRKGFEVGCKVGGGQTLDQIFLCPDVETCNQKVLADLSATLKMRYTNIKNFSLPERVPELCM